MNDNIVRIHPLVVAEAGGLVDETGVCLALYGDALDPKEITALLGNSATHSHRKGDLNRSGRPFATGAWLFEVRGNAPESPEELTCRLLDQLPSDPKLWSQLSESHGVQLRYGLHMDEWNRGFDLSAQTVARISLLRASIGFDIYAHGPNGDV
ncbi:MAG: hypothetical protein DRJ65_15365 [Acidobacteria bacterium]|nr:MAG: hypothetical protein DRJ65_15365 [Acidobacteriota bacterium]